LELLAGNAILAFLFIEDFAIKIPMTLCMSRLGRRLGFLLLGIGVGLNVGCSSPKGPLPPGGSLRENSTLSDVSVPAADEYELQAGDEIDIQVYREPELSGTFQVKPSGQIRHPLVGSVGVEGKTVKEAEVYFTKRLAKDYLVNPRVIIKIVSTQSSQIVLLGEVKEPGVYPLPFGEGMTLLQAIAGAGGFTELASPDRVRIVRKGPDGKQTTQRVRVSNLLGGGKQEDIPLEPNDVIMVPEVVF
jgi:protein involved in polysaccharide export with SLBB domain